MTELRWEGKYDSNGKKVAPPRICLPFQTVETVNESTQERQKAFDLFSTGRETEWRNRLIWGDKKYVLPSLLPEFAGKVDLIYIDPPFDTGADFSFTTTIPDSDETFVKEPSVIEQKAYRDTWGKGLDSYLKWFYETVVLMRELLADNGSIYVHLDWHVGHYAKSVLDEVFGMDCFQNEIAWCYREAINSTKRWNRKHDNILLYSKSPEGFCFNANVVLQPHAATTVAKYKYEDENGKYRLMGRGIVGSPIQSARDISPEWEKTHPDLVYRHYLRDGTYGVDYFNIDIINQASHERLNYPTQKPEALLEQFVKASSNKDDLVLDCFCGSGTTAAVAEKLGRRWITCDLGRFAIHTARKRLLGIENVKPFVLQNLGKYERQQWQAAEFGELAEARTLAYRNFLLDLYRARPLSGYVWLHGVKNGRMVHVGAVDSPISVGDVQNLAIEFRRVTGTGKDAPTTPQSSSNMKATTF
jgi:DNA modification methylase